MFQFVLLFQSRNVLPNNQIEMSYMDISKSTQDLDLVLELLFSVHVCLASFENDCVCFAVPVLHAVVGYDSEQHPTVYSQQSLADSADLIYRRGCN